MQYTDFNSKNAILRLCLLVVPLWGFLIIYMSSAFQSLGIINLGNPTIWLILFLITSLSEAIRYRSLVRGFNTKVSNRYLTLCLLIIFTTLFHAPFVSIGSRYVYFGLFCYVTCFLAFRGVALHSTSNNQKSFQILLWALFAIMAFVFLYSIRFSINVLEEEKVFSTSYIILYTFPIIMLLSNKKMGIVCTILVLLSLFFSNKRGSFITGGVVILVYYLIENIIVKNRGAKRFWAIIIMGVVFFAGYYYFTKLLATSDIFIVKRLTAISNDDGSGRTEIWDSVINSIEHSTFIDLFFGHGLESVRNIAGGLTAHNDYLEVIYDFGIIVFVAYVLFMIVLIRHSIYLIKCKSYIASSFFSSVLLFIIPAFFSHIILYPQYFLLFSMYWGYTIGLEKNKSLNN